MPRKMADKVLPIFDFNIDESWELTGKFMYGKLTRKSPLKRMDAMRKMWESSKEPLLKLFPAEARIVSEFEPEPSDDDKYVAIEAVKEYLQKQREKGKLTNEVYAQAVHVLVSCVLGRVYVQELADNKLSRKVRDPRNDSKELQKELRLSTYANYWAEASFGSKCEDGLNTVLADALSMGIQSIKNRKSFCVLSANPFDIVTSSEYTRGWNSCHQMKGACATGPLAYLVDSPSVIAFVYDNFDVDKEVQLGYRFPIKLWREIVHIDLAKHSAITGREFPSSRPLFSREIRRVITELLCADAGLPFKEPLIKYIGDNRKEDNDTEFLSGGTSYNVQHVGVYNYKDPHSYRIRLPKIGMPPDLKVGVTKLPCPACGELRSDSETKNIMCRKCTEKATYICNCCGEFVADGERVKSPNGAIYCRKCFDEQFYTCGKCGVWGSKKEDVLHKTVTGEVICPQCFEKSYIACSDCSTAIPKALGIPAVDGKEYCLTCIREKFEFCSTCDEFVLKGDFDGKECRNCFNSRQPVAMPIVIPEHTLRCEMCDLDKPASEFVGGAKVCGKCQADIALTVEGDDLFYGEDEAEGVA